MSCIAQKYDYIWVRGTGSLSTAPPEYRTSFMDFATNPPKITLGKKNPPLLGAIGSMSDSTGKLLFFTNLIQVFNANEDLMENGEKINEGKVWNDFKDKGYPSVAGTKIIPIFNDSLFLMIYVQLHSDQPNLIGSPARYAIIDPYFQNGKGKVIVKDKPYHYGTTLNYDFVRHGNGKDWWLYLCEWNVDEEEQIYYKFLVDEKGKIDSLGKQTFNLPSGVGGVSRISKNGNVYIKYSGNDNFDAYSIFDIDRCSGILSFRKKIQFNKVHNMFGFEISPNGRYIYPSRPDILFQIDVESNDSYLFIDTIGFNDGYNVNNFGNCFGIGQITPYNEIMILSRFCNPKTINIIHKPDLPGQSIDFEQHAIIGPNFAAGGPQYPNYRLGSLEGSPCDTLAFNNTSNSWEIHNDSLELCALESQANSFTKLVLRIYNKQGDNLLEEQFFSQQNKYCITTTSLLPGEYVYYLWVDDKKILMGTLTKP